MGKLIDKAKGAANEVVGKAKVAAGERTDNPGLILKGTGQQVKGKVQKAKGALKGAFGDKI